MVIDIHRACVRLFWIYQFRLERGPTPSSQQTALPYLRNRPRRVTLMSICQPMYVREPLSTSFVVATTMPTSAPTPTPSAVCGNGIREGVEQVSTHVERQYELLFFFDFAELISLLPFRAVRLSASATLCLRRRVAILLLVSFARAQRFVETVNKNFIVYFNSHQNFGRIFQLPVFVTWRNTGICARTFALNQNLVTYLHSG